LSVYIDTSAAVKLLILEHESEAVRAFCDQPSVDLVSSDLLETELRRAALRETIPQAAVTSVLEGVTLHELPRSVYSAAGQLPGPLRSLDALHLASAIRLGVDVILVYDTRLIAAAAEQGIRTHQPKPT
jgi:predicted nucleic acid-binding protein